MGEPRPAEQALGWLFSPQALPRPILPSHHLPGSGSWEDLKLLRPQGLNLEGLQLRQMAGGGPRSFLDLCGVGQGDSPCHSDQDDVPGQAMRMVSEHCEGAGQGCFPLGQQPVPSA